MSLKSRRFILGDIHGCVERLEKVLSLASFDIEKDSLYFLGDIGDRGDYTYECIKILRAIPKFKAVVGNHDLWLRHYLLTGEVIPHWINKCGGASTITSIEKNCIKEDERYSIGSWISSWPSVLLFEDSIIVHGGIPWGYTDSDLEFFSLSNTPVPLSYDDRRNMLVWNRSYLQSARKEKIEVPPYKTTKTIYVGHTPIGDTPFYSQEYHLMALDTGSGYAGGVLTLMDMDSKEYFQA